jgi:putative transposase
MNWKQLLASITGSVDEELRLRHAYLEAENRVMRHQIKARRVQLTDVERKTLAEMGHKLGRQALEEIATVAKPDTILAWHRTLVAQTCDGSKPCKTVGRPRMDQELEALVVRMAHENRSWGYDRIVGALANLGYTISDQTVGNILKRYGIPPAPERKMTVTWKEFIRIHRDVLMATDFFTRDVGTWFMLVIASLISVIRVGRRTLSVPVTCMMACLQTCGMLPIPRRCPDGHATVDTWVRSVVEQGLSWRLLCGERSRRPLFSAFETHNHRPNLPPGMGTMVCMLPVNPHPIRDGPQRLDRLRRHDTREAA